MAIASNSTPNFMTQFYDARSAGGGVNLTAAHNFHSHFDNSQWSNNQIGIFMDAQNQQQQQRYPIPPYNNVIRSRSADARMGYEGMENVHFPTGNAHSSSLSGSVHGSFATVAEDDLLSQNSGSFETTQSSRSQPLSPMDSGGAPYSIYTAGGGGGGENGHHINHNNNNAVPQSYYYPQNVHQLPNFENTGIGPPPPLPYYPRDKQIPTSPNNDHLAMLNDHSNGHTPFVNNLGAVHPAYHEAQQHQQQQQMASLASPTSIDTSSVASFYGTNH
ncbi:hypothetical protein L7F22_053992 [Adiantum nelumboides]|nr:hypothetical protein [Adiantum nelumboides]